MKVAVELTISAEEFYNIIIQSVIDDIKNATGKDVVPVKGFEYEKSLKRFNNTIVSTKCVISELVQNEIYQFKITTPVETTISEYKISTLGDRLIKVEYEEKVDSDSKKILFSIKLVSLVSSVLGSKRKMRKKLISIQNYINMSKVG